MTVVGFNGLFSSVEAQAAVMKFLGVKNYRGIFLNAPGHLGTYSPAGVTFKQWIEDVVDLLKAEKANNIIGFGSSLGGGQALYLGKMFPGKRVGLVLDNPLIEKLRLDQMIKLAPAWVGETIVANKPRPKSETIQKGLGVNFHITVRPDELINVVQFVGTFDRNEIKNINLPTVLFYGADDRLLNDKNKLGEFTKEIIPAVGENPVIIEQNGPHSWGQQDLEKYYTSQVWAIETLRKKWLEKTN